MKIVVICALLLSVIQGITSVYFTEKRPVVCLNTAANVGTTLGRVFAHSNIQDNCSTEEPIFGIDEGSGSISVNSSGWLQLTEATSSTAKGASFTETITARCTTAGGLVSQTNTTLQVVMSTPAPPGASLTDGELDDLCYSGTSDTFYVEENIGDLVVGTINRCRPGNGITVTYEVKPKTKFSIDPDTSDIRLLRPLDRESLTILDSRGKESNITGIQLVRISCTVISGGVTYTSRRRTIKLSVIDVNDSPPVFANYGKVQYLERNVDIAEGSENIPNVDEVVFDSDTWQNNSHVIQVINDPKSICKAKTSYVNSNLGKTICRFLIKFVNLDQLLDTVYRCEVRLVDTSFIQQTGSNANNSATILVNIRKRSTLSPQPERRIITKSRTISRDATRFSRVIQLASSADAGATYSLLDNIFGVTRKYGIVYIDNTSLLVAAPENITIIIHGSSTIDVHLRIRLIDSPKRQDKCDFGCSVYDTTASCTEGCGLGLLSGNCVMRGSESNSQMDPNYGTCTHDKTTCPDGFCDELEDMFPSLCPQDCTTEVIGLYQPNQNSMPYRGIAAAKGPCWCEEDLGVVCTCMPGHYQDIPDPPDDSPHDDSTINTSAEMHKQIYKTTTAKEQNDSNKAFAYIESGNVFAKPLIDTSSISTTQYNITEQGKVLAIASEETASSCDNVCATGIGLGLGAFIAITFSLFMLWFTKRKNDRRKNNLKHVGSVVSMTVVPSDYYDESDRRVSYSSPQWTPKGPVYSAQSQPLQRPENSKWEIPRDSLTLDQTLGEGEFGLVVKAKALGIDGEHTEKNVAVKMLKHCSTAAEEQDLWSEFNLLKDVSHPNVIKLLGVCTGEGPFYVIVEYCEHGCLLKYLRRSRLEENGYVNHKVRYRCQSPDVKEQTDPNLKGDILSMRDLLSFAWQIAKGMSYLSSIKLVHRDLAARNVLVSAGRMLKISDFGLTRDVYEADTYLKKSRGRIPVKWLAPESLYAQIYTTKSDVWSYGIVLWEIVTLGAPPYPGIPPERLYNLLIGGYRMDRPENCPDEMYAVMQKCWKTDASDRPTFSSLAEIFDRILQEKTGYLDLSSIGRCRNDFYKGCLNSSSEEGDWTSEHSNAMDSSSDSVKIDDINLTTVCNDTYLTPAGVNTETNSTPLLSNNAQTDEDSLYSSPGKRKTEGSEGGGHFLRKVTEITCTPQKQSRNLVHPSENVSLLKDSGRAIFVNLPDSTGDENMRVTLEC